MEKKTIKKNDIYTIEIEDLSTDGSGIGKVDGYTLFVKDALILVIQRRSKSSRQRSITVTVV